VAFGAGQGCVGDLCRATSGEGETEPKQIGKGTKDSTEQLDRYQGNIATLCFRPPISIIFSWRLPEPDICVNRFLHLHPDERKIRFWFAPNLTTNSQVTDPFPIIKSLSYFHSLRDKIKVFIDIN
jgi:hypothetical protein